MQITRKELWRREKFDTRYFIYGKEMFLVERCLEIIRQRALEYDYSERISMTVAVDFHWDKFTEQIAQLDLFGSRKLVELRLPPSGRPGTAGAKILAECVTSSGDDVAVVLIAGSIESAVKRSSWFKKWQSEAVAVDNPELRRQEFSHWIRNALDRKKLAYHPNVVDRLAYYFEGNMLAAANEIQKLALGDDGALITVEEIDRIVADQARFSVFSFVDACLSGSAQRALRQLGLLKNEGTEPILILWAMARELRIVYQVAGAVANGSRTDSIFNKLRIWKSRQDMLSQAARRLGFSESIAVMNRLARADRVLKGREPVQVGDIWDEFETIVLQVCGINRATG